jgi:large subunit ribosomal protein L23
MSIFSKEDTTKKRRTGSEKKSTASQSEDKKPSMKDLYQQESEIVSADKSARKKAVDSQAYRVIMKPLITEKASHAGALNKYYFVVSSHANKIEIAKAIYHIYGIKPTDINIINMLGKQVKRGKLTGKRKDWKKAIITLAAGKSINIYEGV